MVPMRPVLTQMRLAIKMRTHCNVVADISEFDNGWGCVSHRKLHANKLTKMPTTLTILIRLLAADSGVTQIPQSRSDRGSNMYIMDESLMFSQH